MHQSVLLKESIAGLKLQADGIYVDGTLGRGGHSLEILKHLLSGHLYSIDKDQAALDALSSLATKRSQNWTLIKGDYRYLKKLLAKYQVTKVDGIILDIGVSSPQFDDPTRGFSYRHDYRLDMRMDQTQEFSAYDLINSYSDSDLARIFYQYGEERYGKLIAEKIVSTRQYQPITTTLELVEIIKAALPAKALRQKGHPAKRVFQAIRIEVNDELNALSEVIDASLKLLNLTGRLAIITFHSLEDKIVKQKFNAVSKIKTDIRLIMTADQLPKANYQIITKKPITPSDAELTENRRAKSAKLRIIERKGAEK